MNVISLLTPKAQVGYLYEDYTVRQGLERMRVLGYTALPVLARDGRYVGTVSEGDFLWHMMDRGSNSLRAMERSPLRVILRENFNPAVSIEVTLEQLVERAMSQSFVPLVDDRGAFVGMVTRQAIMGRLALPAVHKLVEEYSTALA